jgi:hypothetical protein
VRYCVFEGRQQGSHLLIRDLRLKTSRDIDAARDRKTREVEHRSRATLYITDAVAAGVMSICVAVNSLKVSSTARLVSGEFRSGIPK